MDEASSYAEWREAAIAHDKASGVHEWVESDESKHFDYVSIRRRLERLRKLRAAGDHERLLYALNEGIHGNIDGIGRRALYGKAKFGTKRLIMEYVDDKGTNTLDEEIRTTAQRLLYPTRQDRQPVIHRAVQRII